MIFCEKNLRLKEEVEHSLNSVCVGKRFTKAIVVLISIILGALILAGLYALLDDTVLPTLTTKIQEMFNYTH